LAHAAPRFFVQLSGLSGMKKHARILSFITLLICDPLLIFAFLPDKDEVPNLFDQRTIGPKPFGLY